MPEEDRSFQDVIGDMVYGSDEPEVPSEDDDPEDEASREAPDASAPEEESPEVADKPEAEPELEEESEEDVTDDLPEGEATDEPEPEPEEPEGEPSDEGDLEDVDTEVDEEPEIPDLPEGFEIKDGQIVAKVDGDEDVPAEELRKGYLRQADYTRKTQELARQREQLSEARQGTQELVRDLNAHDDMREFLSENPDALEYLVQDPDGARHLLRNREDFEAFKDDYRVLQENPRLAEAYLKTEDEQEAQSRLQQERVKRNVVNFTNELDRGIEYVAQHEEFADHIDESDVEEVRQYVLNLAGFDESSSPEEIVNGVQKLANVFVTPDGEQLDMQLVIDRFEAIKNRKMSQEEQELAEEEEHNEKVDEALEEQKDRPPSTPEGDGSPAAEAETTPKRDSFGDVLSGIKGED